MVKHSGKRSYSRFAAHAKTAVKLATGASRLFRKYSSTKPKSAAPSGGSSSGPWANPRRFKKSQRKRGGLKALIAKTVRQVTLNDLTSDNSWSCTFGGQVVGATNASSYWSSIFLFAPKDLAAISAVINASTTNHYFIKDAVAKTTITSQSASNCKIIAYKCIARRDVPLSRNLTSVTRPGASTTAGGVCYFTDSYGYSGTSTACTYPTQLMAQGVLDATAQTAAATGSTPTPVNYQMNDPSFTPYRSSLFCEYFKVLDTQVIQLEGGGETQVSLKWKGKPKRIDNELIGLSQTALTKGTQFYMFKVTGVPTNDATVTTNVGLTAPKLDMVTELRYHYSWIADNTNNTYYSTNQLPSIGTAHIIAPGTEQVMNDIDA
jgi:hypothetical protein